MNSTSRRTELAFRLTATLMAVVLMVAVTAALRFLSRELDAALVKELQPTREPVTFDLETPKRLIEAKTPREGR